MAVGEVIVPELPLVMKPVPVKLTVTVLSAKVDKTLPRLSPPLLVKLPPVPIFKVVSCPLLTLCVLIVPALFSAPFKASVPCISVVVTPALKLTEPVLEDANVPPDQLTIPPYPLPTVTALVPPRVPPDMTRLPVMDVPAAVFRSSVPAFICSVNKDKADEVASDVVPPVTKTVFAANVPVREVAPPAMVRLPAPVAPAF